MRVRTAKLPPLDAESQEREKQRKETIALAETALPIARTAWLQGDFAGVKEALAQLADKTDFLDTDTAVEIDLLLGKAHVAFDDTPLAVAAFARVLARKPRIELSPYHDSPKVLEAWQKAVSQTVAAVALLACRGHHEEGPPALGKALDALLTAAQGAHAPWRCSALDAPPARRGSKRATGRSRSTRSPRRNRT